MDGDAHAIQRHCQRWVTALVSNSFEDFLSLYGERVGDLSVVCEDAEIAARVLGQLKRRCAEFTPVAVFRRSGEE